MEPKATSVSRCLDRKLTLFGFEMPDLIAVFLLLAVLNLIFGQTKFKLILTWLPTAVFALAIRIAKHGKPDNYWLHWLRFKLRPKVLSAFSDPTRLNAPPHLATTASQEAFR